MNTNELLASWSALSLEEIQARLAAGTDGAVAEQLLGAAEVEELRQVLETPQAKGLREAVVLMPGFMGSLLTSVRGITTLLWINPALFLKGQSRYLEMGEDGTGDRDPLIESAAFSIEKLVYLKISLALRNQTDLYEFPYDWRRPIEHNADLLHQCIERWAGDGAQQFTLVGHSMGGIVARTYLARHTATAEHRIKRLIMHGTPHFGTAGAVEGLVVGNSSMALMEKLNKNNVLRRLTLNMPSVYELLPAPTELFPSTRPYPANWDLYDAAAWQVEGLRQDYLDGGRRLHQLLAGADPQVDIVEIAGCHIDTVVEVQRNLGPGEKLRYKVIRVAKGPDGGDGTVPLWSAILPGARMYYIQQVHRYLPGNGRVIAATLDLIHDGAPDLPIEIPPPKDGLLDRSVSAPPAVEAKELRRRLESGTGTAEDLSRLYLNF